MWLDSGLTWRQEAYTTKAATEEGATEPAPAAPATKHGGRTKKPEPADAATLDADMDVRAAHFV